MASKTFNTRAYIKHLSAAFELLANKQVAREQSAYMKNLFPFFGIKAPERYALLKGFIAEQGLPPFDKLEEVVRGCYQQKERDFHLAAIYITGKYIKQHHKAMVPLIEVLLTNNCWWDSVDSVSSVCIRPLLLQYPELTDKLSLKWVKSGHMWLQRSALICQIGLKQHTNQKVLFRNIEALNGGKEFFINKAIGWALREYSKTHPIEVREFMSTIKLSPLSVREGGKYLPPVK